MSDALGSVTGTLNASQAVVNTYRYKPYGELLAKTGAGLDPRILWGGYRASGAFYDLTPSRMAMTYQSQTGQIARSSGSSTRTLVSPTEAQGNCGLACRQRPLNNKTYAISKCGGWGLQCQFRVTNCKFFDGYVVQEIILSECLKDCKGGRIDPKHSCNSNRINLFGCAVTSYYEAWKVVIENGNLNTEKSDPQDGALDYNTYSDVGACTAGTVELIAIAAPISLGGDNIDMFKVRGLPDCAGVLRATESRPSWWPPKGAMERRVRSKHSCCCDGKRMKDCDKGPYIETAVALTVNPCQDWINK